MQVVEFEDGVAIQGEFPSDGVLAEVVRFAKGGLPLVIADPPYGNVVADAWDKVGSDDREFCRWMLDWTKKLEKLCLPNSALYVWGGTGKPRFRPFYRYLVDVELETGFLLANHVTWSKKRAYGVAHNYLYTREEVAYLLLGADVKKPRKFNIPLLDQKRGYAGFNPKYAAKSEYLRRTNVWTDITELFRGKVHSCQKPVDLMAIPIGVHTDPGEVVLDPFAGSGATAFAARKLGRRFVIVEREKEDFDRIVDNLRANLPEPAPMGKVGELQPSGLESVLAMLGDEG